MSYNTNIQETQMEVMPELYVVEYGGSTERFTNYATDIVFLGHTYTAISIKRTSITKDADLRAQTFTITTIPTDFFRRYVPATPVEPVGIKLYRALYSDLSSYALIFQGLVKSVQFSGGQVGVECIANAQYLRKKIPSYIYQAFCNHRLFNTQCGVNKLTYKVVATMTSVSGTTLKAAVFATKPNGWFNKGYIELSDTGDKRMIIAHSGDTIVIHAPFDSRVAVGISLNAYPGCDGSPTTCQTKFNNYDNALLMPLIPSRNPVVNGCA